MNGKEIPGRGAGRMLVSSNQESSSYSPTVKYPDSDPETSSESNLALSLSSSTSMSSPSGEGSGSSASSTEDTLPYQGSPSNRARATTTSPNQHGSQRGSRHDNNAGTTRVTRKAELVSKQGKNGKEVQLGANYVLLETAPSFTIHQYQVKIDPVVDSLKLRKALVRRMFENTSWPHAYVGGDLLSPKKLDKLTVEVPDKKNDSNFWKVTLKCTGSVESGDSTYISVYNQLLRKFMSKMGLSLIGRHFYDKKNAIEVPEFKLTLYPGFITSIRNHENQVLLCVETTSKILRNDTVLEAIQNAKSNDPNSHKKLIDDNLTGAIVLTTYNDRTYTIAGMNWDKNPQETFRWRDEEISLVDYYKRQYDIQIQDLTQPLIFVLPAARVQHDFGKGQDGSGPLLLVPELCKMTGLSEQMRSNFTLMKGLAPHLDQSPQKRVELIKKLMQILRDTPEIKKDLEEWTLSFATDLVELQGRVLPQQAIVFNSASQPDPGSEKADWTAAFRSKKMATVAELKRWTLIVPQRDSSEVDNFVRTMDRVGKPLGFHVPRPTEIIKVPNASPLAYMNCLKSLRGKANDLVIVILTTSKPELYSAVKQQLSGEFGVISQCFLAKNLRSKGLMSIATKVVIQINAKLGGEPWTVKWPIKNMMAVGLDAYRGTKKTGGRNVAAMVASLTDTHARYYSAVSCYNGPEELAPTITADLLRCVNSYMEFNSSNKLPERILFFRGGVGDGDLNQIVDTELSQVVLTLQTLYKERGLLEMPKLTYVIVTKKINTRLFTVDPKGAKNPQPGTVVDDVITLPERYDFYLVPQTTRQGTVSPSAYNVIYDTNNFGPDKIQSLTYKFCHMYFNWSGTVAVPAPCQYAHKLANLIGVAIGKEANEKLAYNLHFL